MIDPRFEGRSFQKRVDLVEPALDTLPESIRCDIITLYLFAPDAAEEPDGADPRWYSNGEFESATPVVEA